MATIRGRPLRDVLHQVATQNLQPALVRSKSVLRDGPALSAFHRGSSSELKPLLVEYGCACQHVWDAERSVATAAFGLTGRHGWAIPPRR